MNTSEILLKLNNAGLRSPKILTLAITDECNLECRHCWVNAGNTSFSRHVPSDKLRRVIEEFAAIGGEGVRITGGEPLCHPDFLGILKLLRYLKFKSIILQTNAMLLRDEHLTALNELNLNGFTIQVSLDGATALTHDQVRGEGAYIGALQGITKLLQAGLGRNISIFFTEMKHNIGEIPDMLELANSRGIGSFISGSLVMCGRASKTSLLSPPDAGQYLSLLGRYDSDAGFREVYDRIGTVAALEWWKGDADRHEHCTFIENPYLTPSGRFYPCLFCHSDEYSVTEVFEKNFINSLNEGIPLWSTLLSISKSRTLIITECHCCPGKHRCAGGCMGRAWGSFGDLLSADDRCVARRTVYNQLMTSVMTV